MGLLLNKIRTGAILSWHYITVSQLKLQFISLLIIDSKLHVLNSDLVLDIYMCDSIKCMKIVNNDYLKVSSLSHYKLDVYVNNMTFYEWKFLDFFLSSAISTFCFQKLSLYLYIRTLSVVLKIFLYGDHLQFYSNILLF